MASINDLKNNIDLHDLAQRLGLERPSSEGNYKSPHHGDKSPSLSIYENGTRWKDFSGTDEDHGTCIDLVMYVQGCEIGEAIKWLRDEYDMPSDPKPNQGPAQKKSRAEYIADRCFDSNNPEYLHPAIEYLTEKRAIDADILLQSLNRKAVGYNVYHSDSIQAGNHGHGGPAVAFITRTMNPGHVMAVDMRYLDPELNGGTKTQCQGEKSYPWFMDLQKLKSAHTVYVVESPINALSIESCKMPGVSVIATRGTNSRDIDWRFLQGKRTLICMDNDEPNERTGYCPGSFASWQLHEQLTSLNIASHFVEQGEWEHNDVNDILQDVGAEELKYILRRLEPWVLPGVRGDDNGKGKPRVFMPGHDFAQYWRYRAKEDFTTYIKKRSQDEQGEERDEFMDLCGFRVASISRVTIASATSTMTGEQDTQPKTLFAVSVQAPRHGNSLLRRVLEDERLHNVDQWKKFGPVFNVGAFQRMVNILERGADLGSRNAVNFVGLAWRDGNLIVNQGPDCYFTDPEKQCPYHNLSFPSGSTADARRVVEAYQSTFKHNAAALPLIWSIGGHLKAFLGFWPHMTLQSDKGAGKSTLIKRMERTISFTMFSGQSLQTEFRLLTSISHTSHPVGWEEISARRQDVIDKAVSLLQESYQYSISRRGSDMTEYLITAPVLLAGEDVPVKSLSGKLVRTDLTGKKGPIMPEDLPRFPVMEWLQYLATHSRKDILHRFNKAKEYAQERCRASGKDEGAKRMVENYGALLTAWGLLCDFAKIDRDQGALPVDLLAEMNGHIADTSQDREPWVWITELAISEIEAGNFKHPYIFDLARNAEGEKKVCLLVRTSHIIDHISHTSSLRDKWNMLPVKSDRVFKKQITAAGVLANEDLERTIGHRRYAHLVAIDVELIRNYGLYASVPEALQSEVFL